MVTEWFKISNEFAYINDEEFLKGACQLRAISNDHYPQLDLSFLNNDKDD